MYRVTHYKNDQKRRVKLTELKLKHDSIGYYLSATYRIDDEHSVRELNIPKIRLNITPGFVALEQTDENYDRPRVDIGFGFLELSHTGTKDHVYMTETILEEKTQEMTLTEIEQKLGHKVKIING